VLHESKVQCVGKLQFLQYHNICVVTVVAVTDYLPLSAAFPQGIIYLLSTKMLMQVYRQILLSW